MSLGLISATWVVGIQTVLAIVVVVASEIRLIRRQRRDRIRAIEELARTVGIAPAIRVALALDWIGEGDVRSDGDTVSIKLRRWRLR